MPPKRQSRAAAKARLSEQRIETYVDEVKDAIDGRGWLSPAEQIAALKQIVEYIEMVSIPDTRGHR